MMNTWDIKVPPSVGCLDSRAWREPVQPRTAFRLGAVLGALLQALDGPVREKLLDLRPRRALDRLREQRELPAEANLERVGRAGAVRPELLEGPRALEVLQPARLALPRHAARLVVGEAQLEGEAGDGGVDLALDEGGPPVGVRLEHLGALHRPLPLRRAGDVGGYVEAARDGRVDLERV